jgi:peptidoglycan/xylan/chitin deacetylase (PgdA/CDA1 family)
VPTSALKHLAKSALHGLGIVDAVRYFNRDACRILMYHRFPADHSHLEKQCEHIRKHYHPVSMHQVAESLRTGRPLPQNALAFTVDDGFRDFLEHAFPVLQRYEIPATVFLVTDFLDGKLWLWFNQVDYMLERTHRKIDSKQAIRDSLKRLATADRLQRILELQQELEVALPINPPPQYAPMTWDEVRTLASKGVEFGPHTLTHPILSALSSEGELSEEIAGSKARVDAELGSSSLHFCYPSGRLHEYGQAAVAIVRESGFATAVTTEGGMVRRGANPYELLRLGVEPVLPDQYFAEMLAGVRTHTRGVAG